MVTFVIFVPRDAEEGPFLFGELRLGHCRKNFYARVYRGEERLNFYYFSTE